MTRSEARRPASSRGATPRPRKIAGQKVSTRTERAEDGVQDESAGAPVPSEVEGVRVDHESAEAPDQGTEPADFGTSRMLASPRTTRVLTGALAVLAAILLGQGIWWLANDEPQRTIARDGATVTVPAGLPVVADELAVLEGVDAAAKAALEIVAVDHKKYDAEIEAAAELMTADFEKQYRKTAGDIEAQFLAQETVVQVNVVAQGVVRANRTELEALIFLNQVVSRVREGEPETVVTPFKVLVKMVHTDQGWLVDGLETDAPRDKKN